MATRKSKSIVKRANTAVIVPVYNSLATLQELIDRLSTSLSSYTKDFEIILVDDRGPQPVWPIIENAGQADSRIKGIRLSRNFGQHAAISAGLELANADWYVVMDCDLQDLPEDIPKLYQHAVEQKLDSVLAFRASQSLRRRRKLGSTIFNKMLEKLADIPATSQIGNFRIFNDAMAKSYRMYPEKMRLFPALMGHIGFEVGQFDVTRPDRVEGESNYTFKKLFQLGFDSIVSNTIKPMYYLAGFGIFISMIAVLLASFVVIRALIFDIQAEGWASLMTVVMLMGGIQIFVISFVGIYVGKVFFEVKDRPVFIVAETSNIETVAS
ncbi:MAG: glycosyltransferase family 2 protein [Hyphomonadaceae bacterium]|nr:glycosyltransferase family 2 protein [Hyphomonadaceae bacterium]